MNCRTMQLTEEESNARPPPITFKMDPFTERMERRSERYWRLKKNAFKLSFNSTMRTDTLESTTPWPQSTNAFGGQRSLSKSKITFTTVNRASYRPSPLIGNKLI